MEDSAKKAVDITRIYGLDSGATNKQQTAYNYLKSAIVSGRYMPEKPLVERELCDMLGISRTPVREALRRLHSEGLVETYSGRGVFVASATLEKSHQLHELKEALEAMAVRLCCERITPEQLAMLRDCLDSQIEAHSKNESTATIDSDMAFHVVLLEGAHSPMLEEQGKSITWQARRYAQLTAYDPAYTDIFIAEHEAIYKAIAASDAAAGEDALHRHITTIRRFQKERWHMLFGAQDI